MAWDTVVKETESFAKQVRDNADTLHSRTLDSLNFLIAEKKSARRSYMDQRNSLDSLLAKHQEDVNKNKTEYVRLMERLKVDRAKHQDLQNKGKGGSKLDDAKSKFVRTMHRLHQQHNEYVLATRDANSYQTSHFKQLLPTTLDCHQCVQELYVRHASEPLTPLEFEFDQNIMEDYVGSLTPAQIVLDDLTYESLQHRQTRCEEELKAERKALEFHTSQLQDLKATTASLEQRLAEEVTADTMKELVEKRKLQELENKEVAEKTASVQRLEELLAAIQQPLTQLGDRSPPAALEGGDMSGVSLDTESNVSTSSKDKEKKAFKLPAVGLFTKREKSNGKLKSSRDDLNSDDTGDNFPESKGRMEDEEWFHGVLPREEVQRLLVEDGDYLVRESKNRKTNEAQYVLSVYWQGHKHFIIQGTEETGWRFEGSSSPTVQELIRQQHASGLPVTNKSQAILKKPILREDWELLNDHIHLEMKIGNGNFGEVYKGVYTPKNMVVAVKTCKDTLSEDQRKKFLQEGRILKQYNHPNIVSFIGIAAQRQPVMIVMEFVPGGALLQFLRKQGKQQSRRQLTQMCVDAASGMAYLEAKNCIHRDLAARNCLVGENNVIKISDFGMSREEEEYTVSEGMKQIPIKWTAPEALNFGYRLPQLPNQPDNVYQLMLRCWEYNPDRRPLFKEIHEKLKDMVRKL
nr:hypothetical protein BaRGS_000074 [Batillaria attramentaria]